MTMAKKEDKAPEARTNSRRSEDARRLLGGEMNVTEIAMLFNVSVHTVRSKVRTVRPLRIDGNTSVYRFVDVLPNLAPLPDDLVERVIRTNHMDLPPMLRKEFWTGQAQMLKVKQAEGELFDAGTVVQYVGELLKIFRMSILLTSDTIEREHTLTIEQRNAIKAILDTALETARGEAIRIFGEKRTDPDGRPGGKGTPELERTLADEAADL